MLVLAAPKPTPEQLRVIGDTRVGVEVIRGAAGSGKTTTALLRLRNLSDMFRARHARLKLGYPVKALVLTYNRTLCGYVETLARDQAAKGGDVQISVRTYAKWARDLVGSPPMIGSRDSLLLKQEPRSDIRLPADFLLSEIEYVMGRFPKNNPTQYLDAERTGRGLAPRVERPTRERVLKMIDNYQKALSARGLWDWEDLPGAVATLEPQNYEIIVVDEAQDFSANQLRSLVPHLSETHSLTLVIDTAQRLYPRGYTWSEATINVKRFHRLEQNHRNTIEIAKFVKGILTGIAIDDDGTIPDLSKAVRHGPKPIVIKGRYAKQLDYAIDHFAKNVDLKKETVAFLHPLGGGWFGATRSRLHQDGLDFDEITRERDWPKNETNIVLSTMHSAKGLEFDHVVILGLSEEVTRHDDEPEDDRLLTLRRLLAMAVSRARNTVLIGYKENDVSKLVKYFEKGTFDEQVKE